MKIYPSLLNYFSATSLAIALKVSSRKCLNFLVPLRLLTREKLMLTNFTL